MGIQTWTPVRTLKEASKLRERTLIKYHKKKETKE
jgi:hypothetical protein